MSESKGDSQPLVTMDSSDIIKVTVKTLKQKEQFEVAQSSTIQEFKEDIGKRFKTPPDLLVLIFAGKVLKDQDTLSQYGVHNGVSIHLVIRSQKRPQEDLPDQGAATTLMQPPSRSNSNLFFLESIADLQNPGLSYQDLSELLMSGQEIVVQTMKELMSRILSSELDLNTINNNTFLQGFLLGVTGVNILGLDSTDVSDLVSSIEGQDVFVHGLISEVAQSTFVQNTLANASLVRDIIMSNPQVQQLAEQNPEIGHILTNPHTIREILEAHSSPAVMQEMVRNHDLAMNNLESIPGGYSALEQLYREVEEPILDAVQAQIGNNLFAPPDSNLSLNGAQLPARTENRRPLPNPWAPQSNRANVCDCNGQLANGTDESLIVLSLGPAAGVVVSNSGEAESMVQQLTGNAELMQNLEDALTNPSGPAQMLLNSDHISRDENSPPQDQSAQQLPPEMENAEISSLLRNPRALQALLQVQLGLQILTTEAPDFMLSLGDSHVELDLESMDESTQSNESEDDVSLVSEQGEEEDQIEMDEQAPQIRYERQMQQLHAMGFQDQHANLQALLDAEGEINAAAEILAKAPSSNKIPWLEDRSGETGWVLDRLWLENVLPVANPMLMVPVPAAVPRLTCPDKANPLQQQLPLVVAGRLCVCWWASALPSLKKPASASATGDSKDSTIASASLLVLRGSQADKHQLPALLASWSSSRDLGFFKVAVLWLLALGVQQSQCLPPDQA
ncbi:ubiquilin-1-like [Mergus octosetaceus]